MPRQQLISFTDRMSDDPHVDRVWGSCSTRGGRFHSIAAVTWEMVVSRVEGKVSMTIRGPETVSTQAECPADGEWFAIRFAVGTYLPRFRPSGVMDRRDVVLENATSRKFWLNGSSFEFPTFENAELFVRRLTKTGELRRDTAVDDMLRGRCTPFSLRTEQRRFRHVTGLTLSMAHQIVRARQAAFQLYHGMSAHDVVEQAGYYDQAHLIRAMQRWIGCTPAVISGGTVQLSFLYNTPVS